MKRKLLVILLAVILITGLLTFSALAEVSSPTTLGAPEHFGVSHYSGSYVKFAFGAPKDLRTYIEKRAADDPENKQTFSAYFQVDYKIDNGSWHHTSEWDSPSTVPDKIDDLYFSFRSGKDYIGSDSYSLTSLFPEDESLKAFTGWDYLENHSITFRARFAHSFDYGKTYIMSPWSKEFTLSANIKADYNKLINNAPSLISADLKATASGEPYFDIQLAELPGDVGDLHSMSGSFVRTEVWMRRAGDKEFKYIEYEWANKEVLNIEASDYFTVDNLNQSYDEESYEIKVRYALDLRKYKQSGYASSSSTVDIYSPFSNVISHNMPAWSNASSWATEELKKADKQGLIPDILKGADLTKPITRKEFAAVSVKLYEKMSGITTTPVKINPFKDTNDQEVLKAYNVGITAGVAADKFAPDELLNREQAATMLTRVFKKAFVKGWTLNADGSFTFNYTAPPKFKDDVKISDWAKPSVYFMVTHGIISGVGDNNFAPRATTSAEQAANYASATREQALAISVRMTEKLDSTNSSEVVPVETQPEESEKPPQNQGNSTEQSQESSNTIVGIWQTGSMTGHEYNAMSGTFRYNSGLGQRYNFKDDGTYTSSIVAGYGSMISITGNYTVTEDKITFSNQKGKVSSDYGDTWKEGNLLKDETYYYAFDNSDSETYLLIGLEDALPPLDIETNAASYFLMDE